MTNGDSMKLDIYLNYRGNCEQAFRFYEQHLGGRITTMMSLGEQPARADVPEDWKKAILHARIEIGNTVLMGADIPGAEPMRSAYLTLSVGSDEEAERLYELLSEGFAMLRDKFGTSWMLLHARVYEGAARA
jgi:PhnB protein